MTRTQSLSALVFLGLAGCSSMTAGRSALLTQKPRTVVSSNDTAVALRDGPDRSTIDTDLDEPEPPSRPDARISGRVVDDRNRPVPNAEVRLADGGARSGRDRTVMTDATGSFTLSNLRPGGSYTIVAEDREGQGGRAEDAAPGTRVTIRLGDDDAPKAASSEPSPPSRRIGRVSERAPVGDVEEEPAAEPPTTRPSPRINRDDLPPAEEAESIRGPSPMKAAWKKGATADPAVATVEAQAPRPPQALAIKPTPIEPELPAPKPIADDGPNPLPPAKERPQPSGDEPKAAPESRNLPEPQPAPSPAPALTPPQPEPSGELPPADKPAATNPPAASPGENPPPAASSSEPLPPANPFTSSGNPTPSSEGDAGLKAEAEPRSKTTWGQLAARESSSRTPAVSSTNLSTRRLPDAPKAPATVAANRSRTGLLERLAGGRSSESEGLAPPTCQYDARRQRIVDFRLPDLDGNPVRFRDLDAEFVLIDFWGTWCKPCEKSIPHLVELQEQYGDKKLRVIGIADVRSPNFEQESKKVREAAAKLGINYSLLLSEADGKPCPLQEALHVEAYPTMVLLDRSGQILWRAKGSEQVTLNRLDKVIAARADTGIVRR